MPSISSSKGYWDAKQWILSYQGFHLEEGGGDFPLLLRHVSPASFDKFVKRQILSNHTPTSP